MGYTGKDFDFCVLIPCYNNLQGLKASLNSIRYHDGKYLIVIVDDGSEIPLQGTDFLQNDVLQLPIQIICLAENKGITFALNTGLRWITDNVNCTYVARLDCGDTCDPRRFYLQMEYLSVNTDVVLLGSCCYFQMPGKKFTYKHKAPELHDSIQRAMYFRNVFIHPTVIFKLEVAQKLNFYPYEYPYAEDYALFWEMMNTGKTAILPLYLVVCEVNKKGISQKNRIKQLHNRVVIVKKFGRKFVLRSLGILKIRILMKIPYSFILYVKKFI